MNGSVSKLAGRVNRLAVLHAVRGTEGVTASGLVRLTGMVNPPYSSGSMHSLQMVWCARSVWAFRSGRPTHALRRRLECRLCDWGRSRDSQVRVALTNLRGDSVREVSWHLSFASR